MVTAPSPALDRSTRPLDVAHFRTGITGSRWVEPAVVIGVLVAIFGAYLLRLSSVLISDMDEGTYLYAGKLVAEGAVPYRDFLLAHPPLLVYLAAGWIKIAGPDVMAARLANLTFVLISTLPLYLVVRRLTRSQAAGLLAIVTYATGNLLLANMGRTIKLEPIMDAFLIAAFAIYILRPDSLRLRVLLGMLVAAALLVKLVAAVPIALLVLGDLIWARPDRRFVRSWFAASVGAAAVLLPAAALLLSQPHFLDDVVWSQLQRGGLPLDLRLHYLGQDFARYPVIPLALVTSAWFMVRERDWRLRASALIALAGMIGLVLLFKTFFTYYIVLVMPWVAIIFAVACYRVLHRLSRHWRPLLIGLTLSLGVVVPLAYDVAYDRSGAMHVSSPAQIIPILRSGSGPIYSMYPLFALWSSRPEYAWYYAADSLIPRTEGSWTASDFVQAFSGSDAVVLWAGELQDAQEAQTYLDAHFRLAYQDAYYSLWLRQ